MRGVAALGSHILGRALEAMADADTRAQIEEALQVLIGLPLWDSGRAGLQWFAFGEKRMMPDIRLGKGGLEEMGRKEVGDYALHLQCAWRIVGPGGIVVGSADRIYAAGDDPYKELSDSEWGKVGATRCDERISTFFKEMAGTSLIVESVWADAVGSVRLTLSGGYVLEAFPNDSMKAEHWRLFRPSTEEPHFVVTGRGIGDYDEEDKEEDEDDED